MRLLIALLLAAGPASMHAQEQPAPDPAKTELEQMQLMIHHAVETAAEGGRLVTLGGAETATELQAAERGRAMISDAREIILQVAAGDAMMRLHTLELSDAANATMIATHLLEQAASSYINALEQALPNETTPGNNSAEE